MLPTAFYQIEEHDNWRLLRLISPDGTNRLTRACVCALILALQEISSQPRPLVIAGNPRCFSAGADLGEIMALTPVKALEFSRAGQELMNAIQHFPAPAYAAIEGYCFGGGLDLALACHYRTASPHAILGHRGAALGLITGWGGTQRLPRLVGKARALQMFIAAEKIHAEKALRIGLIDAIAADPVAAALQHLQTRTHQGDAEKTIKYC